MYKPSSQQAKFDAAAAINYLKECLSLVAEI
jgi:hypothetical protein